MAMSKCIKCDSTHFELVVKDGISGSKYKICFIQCSNCGGGRWNNGLYEHWSRIG